MYRRRRGRDAEREITRISRCTKQTARRRRREKMNFPYETGDGSIVKVKEGNRAREEEKEEKGSRNDTSRGKREGNVR